MMKKLLGILLIISLFLYGCCEERNAYKQFELGVRYSRGQGVEQDYKKAIYWYKKAAEQGHPQSQHNLGVMYYNEDGFIQDYAKAHMWFNISAYSGNPDASETRDTVSKLMTSQQLAEAQRMAREWVENFEKRQKKKKKE